MLATPSPSRVQVAARVRPLLPSERVRQCKECITATSDRELVVGTDRRFTFDHAVPASATQAELYDRCVAPLVDGCFSGYNATVFAYGQTGSGKTYSMGSGGESSVPESGPGVGIIPRVVDHIFSVIRAEESRAEFLVRVSFLEIYQENLRDLLQPGTPSLPLRWWHLRPVLQSLSASQSPWHSAHFLLDVQPEPPLLRRSFGS